MNSLLRPRPPIPTTAPHKQAYVDLLRQVGLAARRSDGATTGLLRADIPSVMRAVARQLKHKSAKTKVSSGGTCSFTVSVVLMTNQSAHGPGMYELSRAIG